MNEELEKKIRGFIGLYGFYKQQMTTPQRVALLTMWVELCVSKEEYEVANALQKELDKMITGEEEYCAIPPITILNDFDKKVIIEVKEPERKKLKWTNYWGTGTFQIFNFSFGDFKFIILNIGLEMK